MYMYYYRNLGEIKIDFNENLYASLCTLAVVCKINNFFKKDKNNTHLLLKLQAGLGCACGDTLASELGTVLHESDNVYLIVSMKRVPKGTNGGVSLYGTLASNLVEFKFKI